MSELQSGTGASAQTLIDLSNLKWRWMADRNVEKLDQLFDPQAVFVHMGATMSKAEELDIITKGDIQYKRADVEDVSVRFIGPAAIVLSKLRMFSVVYDKEVDNPFTVTEVYIGQDKEWRLASLSFTRLLGD